MKKQILLLIAITVLCTMCLCGCVLRGNVIKGKDYSSIYNDEGNSQLLEESNQESVLKEISTIKAEIEKFNFSEKLTKISQKSVYERYLNKIDALGKAYSEQFELEIILLNEYISVLNSFETPVESVKKNIDEAGDFSAWSKDELIALKNTIANLREVDRIDYGINTEKIDARIKLLEAEEEEQQKQLEMKLKEEDMIKRIENTVSLTLDTTGEFSDKKIALNEINLFDNMLVELSNCTFYIDEAKKLSVQIVDIKEKLLLIKEQFCKAFDEGVKLFISGLPKYMSISSTEYLFSVENDIFNGISPYLSEMKDLYNSKDYACFQDQYNGLLKQSSLINSILIANDEIDSCYNAYYEIALSYGLAEEDIEEFIRVNTQEIAYLQIKEAINSFESKELWQDIKDDAAVIHMVNFIKKYC